MEFNWGLYSQCSPPTDIFVSFKCWTVALLFFFGCQVILDLGNIAQSWAFTPEIPANTGQILVTSTRQVRTLTKTGFSIGISSKTSKFTVVNYDSIFPINVHGFLWWLLFSSQTFIPAWRDKFAQIDDLLNVKRRRTKTRWNAWFSSWIRYIHIGGCQNPATVNNLYSFLWREAYASSLSTVNQWTDSRASFTCIKSQIGKKAKSTVNQCCGRANIHKWGLKTTGPPEQLDLPTYWKVTQFCSPKLAPKFFWIKNHHEDMQKHNVYLYLYTIFSVFE